MNVLRGIFAVMIAVEIEFGAGEHSLDEDSHRILYTSYPKRLSTDKETVNSIFLVVSDIINTRIRFR